MAATRARGDARAGAGGAEAVPGHSLQRFSRQFLRDARGATAIEYAMIAGLIFAVVAGGMRLYGSKVNDVYGRLGNAAAQVQ